MRRQISLPISLRVERHIPILVGGILSRCVFALNRFIDFLSVDGDLFRLGRQSGNYMRSARLDEVAIWAGDQSSNISDIYNGGSTHDLTLMTTPPDHWWRMGDGDTYPNIQDNIGFAHFVMYNMTAENIVTDVP